MKKHILLIDDGVGIRSLLSEILREENYIVSTCVGIKDFQLEHRKNFFDLVLLDAWIPNDSSVLLLQEIMSAPSSPPVLMMGGHASSEIVKKYLKLGAVGFLEKPITKKILCEKIERVMADHPVHRGDVLLADKNIQVGIMRSKIEHALATNKHILFVGKGYSWLMEAVRFVLLHRKRSKPFCAPDSIEKIMEKPFMMLKLAEGGIIFLNEVSLLSPSSQEGLFRLLIKARDKDVLILCATKLPLDLWKKKHPSLNPDLFALFKQIEIALPQEGQELEEENEIQNLDKICLSPNNEASPCLEGFQKSHVENGDLTEEEKNFFFNLKFKEARQSFERAYLKHYLERYNGNIAKMAESVEIERTWLYRKLKQLGMLKK